MPKFHVIPGPDLSISVCARSEGDQKRVARMGLLVMGAVPRRRKPSANDCWAHGGSSLRRSAPSKTPRLERMLSRTNWITRVSSCQATDRE